MKKFINIRPIAIVSLCLLSGILFAFGVYKFNISYFIYLIFFLILLPFVFLKDRQKFYGSCVLVLVIILCFFGGYFSFNARITAYENTAKENKYYRIEGTVQDINALEYYNLVTITNLKINSEKSGYNLNIYVRGNVLFDIGDNISINTVLNSYSFESADYSAYFNSIINRQRYYSYAESSGINYEGSSGNIFLSIKNKINSIINDGMDEETAELSKYMLLGNSGNIDDSLLQNFRYGGIAHIFSVSGLHIALIATILLFLFRKIRINKLLKAIIITLLLLFYSGICGFSVSSLRAAIMCGVYLIIKSTGNKSDSLNILFLAMVIVLMLNPFNLFDVGFQLSFTVVFFIIVFVSHIKELLYFMPQKLKTMFAVTISATLGSMPIILLNFGYISLLSVLTNLIFIPMLSFIFSLLFICICLSFILPFYTQILMFPKLFLAFISNLYMLVDYKTLILSCIKINAFLILLFYIIFVCISDKINFKKYTKTIIVSLLSGIFFISVLIINIPRTDRAYISMFKSGYGNYLLINYANESILISDGIGLSNYNLSKRLSQVNGKKITTAIIVGNNPYNQINRLINLTEIERIYVNGNCSEDLNSFFEIPIHSETEAFTLNKINFCFCGDTILKINLLGIDLLFHGGGEIYEDIEINYNILICNKYNEEDKEDYHKANTFFYKNTDDYINAESSLGLLFTIKNGKIHLS